MKYLIHAKHPNGSTERIAQARDEDLARQIYEIVANQPRLLKAIVSLVRVRQKHEVLERELPQE